MDVITISLHIINDVHGYLCIPVTGWYSSSYSTNAIRAAASWRTRSRGGTGKMYWETGEKPSPFLTHKKHYMKVSHLTRNLSMIENLDKDWKGCLDWLNQMFWSFSVYNGYLCVFISFFLGQEFFWVKCKQKIFYFRYFIRSLTRWELHFEIIHLNVIWL